MAKWCVFYSIFFGVLAFFTSTIDMPPILKVMLNAVWGVTYVCCMIVALIIDKSVDAVENVTPLAKDVARAGGRAGKNFLKKELSEFNKAVNSGRHTQNINNDEFDEKLDEQLRKEGSLHGPSVSAFLKNI